MKKSFSFFVPGRFNLIGEHIDYSGGVVLPAPINLGIRFHASSIAEKEFRITSPGYGQYIPLEQNRLEEHPWLRYFWSVLNHAPFPIAHKSFHIQIESNLPPGNGLSSSTALTCGFVHFLSYIHMQDLTMDQLIEWTVASEHGTGTMGGQMDQHAILFGKKEHLLKLNCTDNSFEYLPFRLTETELYLVSSGLTHELVHSAYNERRAVCDEVFHQILKRHPDVPSLSQTAPELRSQILENTSPSIRPLIQYVWEENNRVEAAIQAIDNKDERSLGPLLTASHLGLSLQYQVSTPLMDQMVGHLIKEDAVLGARMMGGGFGGSILVQGLAGHAESVFARFIQLFKNKAPLAPQLFPVELCDGLTTKY